MATSIPTALIGFGFVGSTFHAPYIACTEGLTLSLVSSRHPEQVAQVLAPFDCSPEVIASPEEAATHDAIELVVIASPNQTHFALAKAALMAGKHVVVDKPFTLDSTEARELAELAVKQGRLLSVFQNRRWDSDFLAIKGALERNAIGPVIEMESRIDRFRPAVRDRWREHALPGSGLWFDLGPHLADQALVLFGLPDEISASIALTRRGAQANDWAQVTLHYQPNGERGPRHVLLHASMLNAAPSQRFGLHGVEGSLVKQQADIQEDQLRAGLSPLDESFGVDTDPLKHYDGDGNVEETGAPVGCQIRYYEEIRDAIKGDAANPVSPLQAVGLMTLLETAVHAAASGERSTLPVSAEERAAWQPIMP